MKSPSPSPPLFSRREILVGIIFLAGFLVTSVLLVSFIIQVLGITPSPLATALLLALFEAVIILPPWLIISRKHLGWTSLGLRGFRIADLALGCGFLVFAYLFVFGWAAIVFIFDLPLPPEILPTFGTGTTGYSLAFLAAGLVAPVSEEVFFRGFVFAGLRGHWGVFSAVIGSAAIFAIFHLIPVSIPPIFILGLFLASLYHLSGSLWPSIIMHATFNMLAVTCSYVYPRA